MEIGSHSATHADLPAASPDALAAEVAGSRAVLREITGQPVRGFAYPYGSVDERARNAVRDSGYDYACAVQPAGQPGPFALPRVYAGQADSPARLTAKRLLYRPYFSRDYYRNHPPAKGNHL
jgi:peptidoglycan/xylan/chitin deacetylase (PgdA/CDA1 family)